MLANIYLSKKCLAVFLTIKQKRKTSLDGLEKIFSDNLCLVVTDKNIFRHIRLKYSSFQLVFPETPSPVTESIGLQPYTTIRRLSLPRRTRRRAERSNPQMSDRKSVLFPCFRG